MGKIVYKWQINGNRFLYITDTEPQLPFIYDSVNETKLYYGQTEPVEGQAVDSEISEYVSKLTETAYERFFSWAKELLSADEGSGEFLHLGTYDLFYNVEECQIPNTNINPDFDVHATIDNTESDKASVTVYYTEENGGRDTHFGFHIPQSPIGYQGNMRLIDAYLSDIKAEIPESIKGPQGVKGPRGERGPRGPINTGHTVFVQEVSVETVEYLQEKDYNRSTFKIPVGPQGDKGKKCTNMWKGTLAEYNAMPIHDNILYAALDSNSGLTALYANETLIIPSTYFLLKRIDDEYRREITEYVCEVPVEIPFNKNGEWNVDIGSGRIVGGVTISPGDSGTTLLTPNYQTQTGLTTQEINFTNTLQKFQSKITAKKIYVSKTFNGNEVGRTINKSFNGPFSVETLVVNFSGLTTEDVLLTSLIGTFPSTLINGNFYTSGNTVVTGNTITYVFSGIINENSEYHFRINIGYKKNNASVSDRPLTQISVDFQYNQRGESRSNTDSEEIRI